MGRGHPPENSERRKPLLATTLPFMLAYMYMHYVPKKEATKFLAVTLSNLNRF